MKATEGRVGRVFVMRLEDGDSVPGCIEEFAAAKKIRVAYVSLVGGIHNGEIVVGPEDDDARPLKPVHQRVDGAHEVSASGVIAPDSEGNPILHLHGAMGRGTEARVGCLRPGLSTWLVGEAVLYEVLDAASVRLPDEESGFSLLRVGERAPEKERPVPEEDATPDLDPALTALPYLFNAELS